MTRSMTRRIWTRLMMRRRSWRRRGEEEESLQGGVARRDLFPNSSVSTSFQSSGGEGGSPSGSDLDEPSYRSGTL